MKIDLHNHSCLSACADLALSPRLLARTAAMRDLDVVALTDHNSARNAPAFALAAARAGIVPLFGLELTTREEAHLLAIFPHPRAALEFDAWLDASRSSIAWSAEPYGDQVVVDEDEGVIEIIQQFLNVALDAGFCELAAEVRIRGGMAIPAHVDREMFSVSSQLGYLPEGEYDAVEALGAVGMALSRGLPVIRGSDAHYAEQVGSRCFTANMPREAAARLRAALGRYALSSPASPKPYPEAEAEDFFRKLRKAIRMPSEEKAI